jgi:hypothetical protein
MGREHTKAPVQLWTRAKGRLAVPPPLAPALPTRVAGSLSCACRATRATDLRDNGRDRAPLVTSAHMWSVSRLLAPADVVHRLALGCLVWDSGGDALSVASLSVHQRSQRISPSVPFGDSAAPKYSTQSERPRKETAPRRASCTVSPDASACRGSGVGATGVMVFANLRGTPQAGSADTQPGSACTPLFCKDHHTSWSTVKSRCAGNRCALRGRCRGDLRPPVLAFAVCPPTAKQ